MMSLILEKKHTKLLIFNIKSDCGLEFFFTFITVLGMSKIRKNIGFDAFLVFEQDQIYIFFSLIYCSGLFLPH